LALEGAKSSAKGARIEAPQAPRVYKGGVWRGGHWEMDVPLPIGAGYGEGRSAPDFFSIFGSQNAYFGAFSGPSRVFVSAV